MADVRIDTAIIHQLFDAAFTAATNVTPMQLRHLGEEAPDGILITARHISFSIARRQRKIEDTDVADFTYRVQIGCGETQTLTSAAAAAMCSSEVAAAFDLYTKRDEATDHQLDLGPAREDIMDGEGELHGATVAVVTGGGTCQRSVGSSRKNFLTP